MKNQVKKNRALVLATALIGVVPMTFSSNANTQTYSHYVWQDSNGNKQERFEFSNSDDSNTDKMTDEISEYDYNRLLEKSRKQFDNYWQQFFNGSSGIYSFYERFMDFFQEGKYGFIGQDEGGTIFRTEGLPLSLGNSEEKSDGATEASPYYGSVYPVEIMEIVRLVNEERAKAGLEALSANSRLMQAADIRSKELETKFSHQRPNGSSCFTAIEEASYEYNAAAENIAYGQKSVAEVMEDWLNSSGHKANILGGYKEIGVGIYRDVDGMLCWVQLFGK